MRLLNVLAALVAFTSNFVAVTSIRVPFKTSPHQTNAKVASKVISAEELSHWREGREFHDDLLGGIVVCEHSNGIAVHEEDVKQARDDLREWAKDPETGDPYIKEFGRRTSKKYRIPTEKSTFAFAYACDYGEGQEINYDSLDLIGRLIIEFCGVNGLGYISIYKWKASYGWTMQTRDDYCYPEKEHLKQPEPK
ncbi:hypothetical protein EJ05DRAFT_500491 [Pseudovirgaria hyperparasitica]|uniref:Uncharacterized protein n=1 Tax=Pseudovirgaria hyperparasitica TaxID=470096 RepID=A0A6A6W8S4_9PEZI|nr:uncharacterized protein EJ05DRAFT_500491 [Pseudovirgaria hyperparasitica]KAF2757977.1 hypothetical protein EJ05DRAFT_500491 [Pseudovirgaria hyperparasitica]